MEGAPGGPISRREFIRSTAVAAGILLGGGLLPACTRPASEDTLGRARQRGFIRVGFAGEVPFGFTGPSGRLTGAAPELAREIMTRLGVPKLDGVLTSFGSLIPDLNAGRFDLIAAGMFITPDRCTQILFADPDYCLVQAFLVREGNPLGIHRYEDIAIIPTATLGTVTGSVEVSQAEESGIRATQIRRFDSPADLLAHLQAGRIDAAALTTISVENLALTSDLGGVEVTEGFAYRGRPGCGAFGFRRQDEAFRDEFNIVLRDMKAAGAVRPLVEGFGFGTASDSAKEATVEDLC